MVHQIYRAGAILAEVHLTGSWKTRVMGEDLAQSTWVMSSFVEMQKGDYILKNGLKYVLSGRPSSKETSTHNYEYIGTFEAEDAYSLIDTQYFMYDQDNQLTVSEFNLTGKPGTFLDLLIKNANRTLPGWSLGKIDDGDAVTLSFSDDDNCRTVLTKLAEQFKTEFWFDGKIIHFTKQGRATGLKFAYGHGKGLYEVNATTPDDFQLITKLYYFGGSKNLPVGYRKNASGVASRKLLGAGRFIQADAETIKKFGVIERSKTFAEIFPEREGVISALGSKPTIVVDNSLDFDIEAQKLPGITAKISFTTGKLAGYEFEINNYKAASKAIEFNVSKDETAFGAEGLPNQYLKPAVGDKYFLYDIQLPAAYVAAAEARLNTKALALLNDSKQKPVKCEVVCSPAYIEQNNLFDIRIGDFVTISSPVLNGEVNIRIVGLTIDQQDPRRITLELADQVTISSIIKSIIEQDNIKNVVNLNQLYDVNRARRNTRTVSELKNYIVDPEGNYYTEKIRAGSIETLYFSNGAKATNFSLRGISFDANAAGDPAAFTISAGELVHFALDIPGVGFTWNMGARTFTSLSPASSYYVYARVSRSSLVGSWVISESIITAEQEAGYWNLQSGVLFPVVEGRRDHEFTKGMTFIIGDQIKAGVLMDISGLNFFNLTNSTFNLGAANNGIDYGVTLANTLTAQNIVIGYGDYISGIGNNGSWPLYIGASSSQRPETAKFRVSRDGTMYAKEGVFEGKITAGPGSKIGDIIIDAGGKLYLAGTKVELRPDEYVKVFNNGVADFSRASKMNIPSNDAKEWKLYVDTSGSGGGASPLPGGGSTTLAGLTDVTLSTLTSGQALTWNGAKWINSNVVADLSALGAFAYRSAINGNEINTAQSNAALDIGVSQYMRWKNYGNGHILFDASNGTSPTGSVIDNKNSSNAWVSSFPTLMGWNGVNTYGVRVDSARSADSWNGAGAYVNSDVAVNTYMMGLGYDGNWHPIGTGNLLNFLGMQAGNYLRKNVESIINAGSADNYRGNVVTFAYATSGTPYNGTLVSLGGFTEGRYDLQLNTTYWGSDRLAFRNRNGDANNWNTWRSLLWNSYDETVTFTGGTGTSYNAATLQLMTASRAPNLSFHWQGVVASSISIERSGRIAIMDNPGTSYENLIANNITANGSVTSGNWFYTSGQCGIYSGSYGIGLKPISENQWSFYADNTNNIVINLTAQGVSKGSIHGDAAGNLGFLDGAGNWTLRYDKTTSHWIGASFETNNWFRSTGGSGWYNETYLGGIYMEDYSWVRVYNGKGLLVEGALGVQSSCFKSTGAGFKSYNHHGMIGSYDQTGTADKIIWTIGDQWNELNTMYGLGYSYDSQFRSTMHQVVISLAGKQNISLGMDGRIMARDTISAGTGTNGGFQNLTYSAGHNNIWRFSNAVEYGIGYYQGGASGDYMGFHFGNRNTPQFTFAENGTLMVPIFKATSALYIPSTSGKFWKIYVQDN